MTFGYFVRYKFSHRRLILSTEQFLPGVVKHFLVRYSPKKIPLRQSLLLTLVIPSFPD